MLDLSLWHAGSSCRAGLIALGHRDPNQGSNQHPLHYKADFQPLTTRELPGTMIFSIVSSPVAVLPLPSLPSLEFLKSCAL